eukprot:6204156-Pleurochrysis_carterae.AAC.1
MGLDVFVIAHCVGHIREECIALRPIWRCNWGDPYFKRCSDTGPYCVVLSMLRPHKGYAVEEEKGMEMLVTEDLDDAFQKRKAAKTFGGFNMRDGFFNMKEDQSADRTAEALFCESADLEATANAAYAM